MTHRAFTDGAARGNPGDAGIGILVKDEKGATVLSLHGYIGVCTNNVAEYTALLTLLERVKARPWRRLLVHSDSELMVRQMNGQYKVRDRGLKPLHARARGLLQELPFECRLVHIPREENQEADELANRGIDERVPLHA
ncbi:MAG: ribonuclease HI family protein [Bacteroidota bacterium]